ncbi:MAG: hypothetical protein R2751_04635 [Bacteroidales bacterium]
MLPSHQSPCESLRGCPCLHRRSGSGSLVYAGETEAAVSTYVRILTDATYDMFDRNFALGSVDAAHVDDPALRKVVRSFYDANKEGKTGFGRFGAYDWLMCEALLQEWGNLTTGSWDFSDRLRSLRSADQTDISCA